MDAATPFAQPPTPDVIIAQLTRQLTADFPQAHEVANPSLEAMIEHTVRALWQSRVKTFVPVFALREVQHDLEARGLAKQVVMPREASPPTPSRADTARDQLTTDTDRLALVGEDIMHIAEDDAMRW